MSLLEILERCRALSQSSCDPAYSAATVQEIVATLDQGIASIRGGTELNRQELRLLFAPTGALQETAMDNNWCGEYLLLSAQFDELIDARP